MYCVCACICACSCVRVHVCVFMCVCVCVPTISVMLAALNAVLNISNNRGGSEEGPGTSAPAAAVAQSPSVS